MSRQAITRELLYWWSDEERHEPLDDFIEWLRSEADELGKGEKHISIVYERGSYDEGDRFKLDLWRWETDEEMQKRETEAEQEAADRKAREEALQAARERALYERLKAKFG